MQTEILWAVFAVLVLGCLAIDLLFLNRKAHVVTFKEAIRQSAFWFALALAFGAGIYVELGRDEAVTFLTGYVVEQSLSVDNLFVILLVFGSFKIPMELQRRVLFWGIIGAFLLRAVCIGVGVVALERFHWLLYIFGAILIWGGVKTAFEKDDDEDGIEDSWTVRQIKRVVPVTRELDGEKFFTRVNGKLMATPLFLVLVVVEVSDLVFAVDSIPAVLAISQDPFIVYTSNIFAILGLRSIFFALAHVMSLFRYLKYALAVILVFVGAKIMLADWYEVPVVVALSVILGLLAAATVASVVVGPRDDASKQK